MPPFDYHLGEQDQRDRVERDRQLIILLKLPIVKEVSCRLELVEGLLCGLVHLVHKLQLLGCRISDEYWHCCQLDEVIERFVVPEVDTIFRQIHLV